MNKGVSKGNAAAFLANCFGINRDEIICIGDNENDISMIEYAGMGIAMENGTDEAKKAAKFVTRSNNDSGVAYAVKKFILKD
jgi:hydroxymethylpyrimidine pyrophosphatase-like HAD family hydrolase